VKVHLFTLPINEKERGTISIGRLLQEANFFGGSINGTERIYG